MASPTPKDLENAMQANDLPRASFMIDQVLKDHPESAKAHYYKAQILEHENKKPGALHELQTAMKIDPSLKFSGTPEKVYQMESRLMTKASVTTVQDAPYVSPPPTDWTFVGFLSLTIALVVGGIIATIVYNRSKREKERLRSVKEKERADKLTALTDMSDQLKKALLILKTTDREKTPLFDQADKLSKRVFVRLNIVKSNKDENHPFYSIAGLKEEVDLVCDAADKGQKKVKTKKEKIEDERIPLPKFASDNYHPSADTFATTASTHSQPSSTVIIQGGNDNSFMDGMILGGILSENWENREQHHHFHAVEQPTIIPDPPEKEAKNDFDFSSSKDSDSGSSWDNSSSSSSDSSSSSSDSGWSDSGGGGGGCDSGGRLVKGSLEY